MTQSENIAISLIFFAIFILKLELCDCFTYSNHYKPLNHHSKGFLHMNFFKSQIQSKSSNFISNKPSWDDLDTLLRSFETIQERDNFNLQQIGRGDENSMISFVT